MKATRRLLYGQFQRGDLCVSFYGVDEKLRPIYQWEFIPNTTKSSSKFKTRNKALEDAKINGIMVENQ